MLITKAKNTHRTFVAIFSSVHCGRVTNTGAALARSIAVTQHLKFTSSTSESVSNQDMLKTGWRGRGKAKVKLSSSKGGGINFSRG